MSAGYYKATTRQAAAAHGGSAAWPTPKLNHDGTYALGDPTPEPDGSRLFGVCDVCDGRHSSPS